jgi:TRAP-type C4-dicarboxylate transport system permease small subunit
MDFLIRKADGLSKVAVWVAGASLILISLVIGGDVIARKLFNVSLAGTDEIGGYVLAASSSWAFAYTLLRRAHIRIDSLARLLPLRLRSVFDILGLAALGAFMALMTLRSVAVLVLSVQFNAKSMTPLKTPLWIPQGLWVVGLIFFIVVILLLIARSLGALVSGDLQTVNRLIGTRTLDEEVAEEIAVEGDPGEAPPTGGIPDR